MELNKLSVEEKVGQMIMVGMETNYITERIETMVKKYKIGGIILYRKNFNTYQDMLKLIKDLKTLNKNNKIPLFIAIDQEGGRVNRMPKEIKNLPSANNVAQNGGEELVKKATNITGKLLRASGFNLNFSPVLDINRYSEQKAIGDRSFGRDKEKVAEIGISAMKELQQNKILSVIKHFPGHGATKRDSHYFLPIINKSIKKLEDEDMYPFKKAIENGADAMMVSHLVIRNITGIYPTSLSRNFITKYIRKKFRFRGLIITDDLKMRAIRFVYGTDIAVRKAFEAGNDIIVFRFGKDEEKRVINKIVNLVKQGKIKECRINRSVKRIINIKRKYEISDEKEIKGINIEEINNEIEDIRKRCMCI